MSSSCHPCVPSTPAVPTKPCHHPVTPVCPQRLPCLPSHVIILSPLCAFNACRAYQAMSSSCHPCVTSTPAVPTEPATH
eukprot:1156072-Pelagomonas_calceolata.AAC.5